MSFGRSGPHTQKFKTGAKLVVYNLGNIKIHTYIAGEDSFGDATHIIESENYLVIIDAQYLKKYAKEFRGYAEKLKKPGSIIITHAHPDHYLGLKYFVDVDKYALPQVIKDIKEKGPAMLAEAQKSLGKEAVADTLIVPNKELALGTVTFDGIKYIYSKYENVEADVQLVIELPKQSVIIVQDIVYNGYHPWLSSKDFSGWKAAIEDLKTKKEQMVYVGHGTPTSTDAYDSMIRYLDYAKAVLTNYDKDNVKRKMVERYKGKRKGDKIIDLYLEYLE